MFLKSGENDKSIAIRKCDYCGKEYTDRFNVVAYDDENCSFRIGNANDEEYIIDIEYDMCPNCMEIVINNLNDNVSKFLMTSAKCVIDGLALKSDVVESVDEIMFENPQCQKCRKYEECTMRKDKEVCLEFDDMEVE